MKLNGDAIVPATQDWYRQHFAVVFSDFISSKVAGARSSLVATQADGWLKTLRINPEVSIQDGEYSTINLSQGATEAPRTGDRHAGRPAVLCFR